MTNTEKMKKIRDIARATKGTLGHYGNFFISIMLDTETENFWYDEFTDTSSYINYDPNVIPIAKYIDSKMTVKEVEKLINDALEANNKLNKTEKELIDNLDGITNGGQLISEMPNATTFWTYGNYNDFSERTTVRYADCILIYIDTKNRSFRKRIDLDSDVDRSAAQQLLGNFYKIDN